MTAAPSGGSRPSTAPLMAMATGFWMFKTLAAAVDLALFTRLGGGRGATADELAAELGLKERPADLLLTACTALGLLDKSGPHYRNSALSEEFLVEGRDAYFGGVVRFNDRAYPAWHRLTDALRADRPLTWDPDTQESLFSSGDPAFTELFWNGMHSLSAETARILGEEHDFAAHRRLLDVGGGSGAFLVELCRRHPHLTGTLYDLPHVCEVARRRIDAAGLGDRITTLRGDFGRDAALPGGHDAILLSMVLHDWAEAENRALLRKCHEALAPGGALLVCELLLNPERTGPPGAALMGVNMLVETGAGRNYAEDEYLSWIREAGFTGAEIRRFDAASANGVIVARRR
ncbi:methyltransferase [Streptomyces sp. SBT349]|uniref:methyltransferase n=1 Tax=Streptomyces sp. SBT349 TaxID=1580539 RepID=UPI000A448585|nr:methyltransferase [Streptomyces sp. SBT349]